MDFLYQILMEGWKLWLIIGILFFIAEGANAGTFALFFGGLGALTTALVCKLSPAVTESGTFQLLIFAGTSLLSMILLRSRIMRMRFFQSGEKLDGPGAMLGRQGRALSLLRKGDIDSGRVLFEGTEWRGTPCEDAPDEIPEGTPVRITAMEGLLLYVKPLDKRRDS